MATRGSIAAAYAKKYQSGITVTTMEDGTTFRMTHGVPKKGDPAWERTVEAKKYAWRVNMADNIVAICGILRTLKSFETGFYPLKRGHFGPPAPKPGHEVKRVFSATNLPHGHEAGHTALDAVARQLKGAEPRVISIEWTGKETGEVKAWRFDAAPVARTKAKRQAAPVVVPAPAPKPCEAMPEFKTIWIKTGGRMRALTLEL